MAKMTYFTDVMMINVHTISDSTPSTIAGVRCAAGHAEHCLERIQWAGADIAKHDPKRGQAQGVSMIAGFLVHQSTEG